ncbi:hypothetical protein BASA50_006104 [Batrachochytrium salamandrivorans]|uniref:Kinesin-like protein n=1 Tax=Batrachochytrium salamandrivorans TaxID=1357716 RepID=A0ABQ8FCA0_9FUNG|nr:hypothetical protein BASA50_006104 [Batrachochytrium salamandrivorans]
MTSIGTTSQANLLDTLQVADLEPYYSSLTAFGIKSVDQLMTLTMQDYGVLGVQSMEDRKSMFQLIQTLKAEQPLPVDGGAAFQRSFPLSSKLESRIPGPSLLPKPPMSIAQPFKSSHISPPGHTQQYQALPQQQIQPLHLHSQPPQQQQQQQPLVPFTSLPSSSSYMNHQSQYDSQPRSLISSAARLYQSHAAPAHFNPTENSRLNTADSYRNPRPNPTTPDSDTDEESGSNVNHIARNAVKKKLVTQNATASPKRAALNLNVYGVPTTLGASLSTAASGLSNGALNSSTASSKSSIRPDISDRIRVCVRKRPLNKKELKKGETDIAAVNGHRTISIFEPKVKVDLTKFVETHEFTFDEAFDSEAMNDDVYRRTAFPLVEYIFQGGKATCFAYGQTGSGKTYTMLSETDGLYVMAGRDIFNLLNRDEYCHLAAWISFYEIYQGQLYDLLNARKKLFAREDGKQQVCIKGIKEYEVSQVKRLMEIFEHGNSTRSTGATGANADSSRSHAILQIILKHRTGKRGIQGKLSFIDLAGSERGADRGETDQKTRMEGSEINKSLLALKECIRALDQDSRHTPFRQSKLTQVLKDSFIGNSKTCMIATISPNISNSEHSLNTLRYAYRVKELKGDSGVDTRGYADDELEVSEYLDDDGDVDIEGEGEDAGDEDVDEPLLLDEEFPPDNMAMGEETAATHDVYDDSEEDSKQHLQGQNRGRGRSPAKSIQKSALLSHLNRHGSPTKRAYLGNSHSDADLNASMVSAFRRSQLTTADTVGPSINGHGSEAKGMTASLEASQARGIQSGTALSRNGGSFSNAGTMRSSLVLPTSGPTSDNRATVAPTSTIDGVASDSLTTTATVVPNMSDIEDLIRMHRQHIRDNTESGKIESKLLVNLTMKPGNKNVGEHGSSGGGHGVSFDNYVRTLDEILANKMNGIAEMRAKMRSFL